MSFVQNDDGVTADLFEVSESRFEQTQRCVEADVGVADDGFFGSEFGCKKSNQLVRREEWIVELDEGPERGVRFLQLLFEHAQQECLADSGVATQNGGAFVTVDEVSQFQQRGLMSAATEKESRIRITLERLAVEVPVLSVHRLPVSLSRLVVSNSPRSATSMIGCRLTSFDAACQPDGLVGSDSSTDDLRRRVLGLTEIGCLNCRF